MLITTISLSDTLEEYTITINKQNFSMSDLTKIIDHLLDEYNKFNGLDGEVDNT